MRAWEQFFHTFSTILGVDIIDDGVLYVGNDGNCMNGNKDIKSLINIKSIYGV